MSKELKALHTIAFNTQINDLNFGNELRIIEQALQRLESIDNAEPSKALEAFDILLQHIETEADWKDYEKVKNAHKIVEQALIKAQKDEKIILGIEDYLNRRIEIEPIEDVRKAFIEIRNQLQVIKEVIK